MLRENSREMSACPGRLWMHVELRLQPAPEPSDRARTHLHVNIKLWALALVQEDLSSPGAPCSSSTHTSTLPAPLLLTQRVAVPYDEEQNWNSDL